MSDYRRWYVPGGTYFFTCITYQRAPILTTDLGRSCLRRAIESVRKDRPFEIMAMVLLPDHFHTIWALPSGDAKFSHRWSRIKEKFTEDWLQGGGTEAAQSVSRRKHRERGVWQRRFWEHTIFSESDLIRCADYIHWNPRKHGLVRRVCDWKWSSFHRFVAAGEYELSWGGVDPNPGWNDPEWGEWS